MKARLLQALFFAPLLLLSGCYFQQGVDSDKVGLQIDNGTVKQVTGPGHYTDMGYYSDFHTIDVSAKQATWSDPDLVTKDQQPIGLSLTITYGRNRNAESIKAMYATYRGQATNDKALSDTVVGRVPGVAKEVTARYTLSDMLGTNGNDQSGRSFLAKQLQDMLSPQLGEVGVVVYDVAVTNIDPGADYIKLLQGKAQAALQTDIEAQKQKQLEAQLTTEQKQTDIDKEIANRQKQVDQIKNSAFTDNPNALELEKTRVQAEALKNCTSFCNWPTQPQVTVQPKPTP